jgi:transcriptional regulator with GAF, ATPase, and Fis domain
MNTKRSILDLFSEAFSDFGKEGGGGNPVARLLNTVIQATNADRGTVYLNPSIQSDEKLRSLNSIIATGIKDRMISLDVDKGVAGHVFKTCQGYFTNDTSSDPHFYQQIDELTGYKTKSIAAVPLRWKDGIILGVLQVLNKKDGEFSNEDIQMMDVLAVMASIAVDHMVTVETLKDTENLVAHRRTLWSKAIQGLNLKSVNPELQAIYDNVSSYATSDSTCLIVGESGTGKEVISRLIHTTSNRKNAPLIAINCAAIPASLFEAELFGVAKGAATGVLPRKGQIEMANRGTLFLDEIGEMPLEMQAKLLRVLQEKRVVRLGAEDQGQLIDFRLVCATNRDLLQLVKEGKFREDLYYRINVISVRLPPLRERKGDIESISTSLIENLHAKRGWTIKKLSSDALKKLMNYPWPGNIRELQNRIECALITSGDRQIIEARDIDLHEENQTATVIQFPQQVLAESTKDFSPMREAKTIFEIEYAQKVLHQVKGNKAEAARRLGMSREGLRKLLSRKAA